MTTMQMVEVNTLKEWVKNWFIMNRHYHPYAKSNNIPIPELYDILERMPTIDAVPVVRCADCVYCNTERTNYPGNDWDGSCDYWNTHSVDFSWFCSQGKRKDGAE